MKLARFSLTRPLWPAILLLAGVILAMSITSAQALPEEPDAPKESYGHIEGHLYQPSGTQFVPVEGGWIEIHDMDWEPLIGTATGPDGSFTFTNLPPGAYNLHAYPPGDSPFAASVPTIMEVFSNEWTEVNLYLTEVGISGYVRDCDAEPERRIEGATVVAHHDEHWVWDSTNISGEFKLGGVQEGVPYILETLPPPETEYVSLPPITVVPVTTGVVLEMCIPPTNVVGMVKDPAGVELPGAGVVIFNADYWEETATDPMGHFHFKGLPPGAYRLQVGPPWNRPGLLNSKKISVVISEPHSLVDVGVITLPKALKSVSGRVVLEGTNQSVPHAMVAAHRLDEGGYAEIGTAPDGAFELGLAGGEWHLSVEPLAWPVTWIFPGPPTWIAFHEPLTATEHISDVELKVIPADAAVGGHITCPGGPCPPDVVPPEDIWVELRNDKISNGAPLNGAYEFIIPIPAGWYELVVHLGHPQVQGPKPIPVFVGPGGFYDVGVIKLLHKNAQIVGWVRNELNQGIEGVEVIGWQPDGFGWGWTETNARGAYTMPVIAGEWFVEPQPGPDIPYVFNDPPKLVRVAPEGRMLANFTLDPGGARIKGTAVDAHTYERLWGLDGWAWAERIIPPDEAEFYSEAPMWDGGFQLKVKGNETYNVGLFVSPHAPYVSGGTGPVAVGPSAQVTVAVPLEHKDAAVQGWLVDALTGFPPSEPIWAEVFGEDQRGNWIVAGVEPHSAEYWMQVVSGTWSLRTWVDPASGYVAPPQPMTVTVESGEVISHTDFEIWPIAASISGQVLKPNGDPLSQTFVFAEGESVVGYFEAHIKTDQNGTFELHVPEGTYLIGAALPREELDRKGWLNPLPIDNVGTAADAPATGLELRFRQLDGVISGTITFAPGITATPDHPAYVWGWAENGAWAETEALPISGTHTFTYEMAVISDTVWHIGAVYEDWDAGVYYESGEAVVPVAPPSGEAIQNLEVRGPETLLRPFIISFDATQMQTIVMPDGTNLKIPPGALADSGTVTLYIFPTRKLRPERGREVIGAGYEIWATDQNGQEITQFSKNVILALQYPPDAVLEANGISEHLLVPVYYSTLVGRWILAESYVVDTMQNRITLQINHFTKFGAYSTGGAPTAPEKLYLPIVLRTH
jgi:hypothetical protein